MPNRRNFLKNAIAATAGLAIGGRVSGEAGLLSSQVGAPPGKRREVVLGGRRIRTVDIHSHCFVPEVAELVKNTPLAEVAKGNLANAPLLLGSAQRLIDMDAQGIDIQAINVNAWGYSAERALARDLVQLQNERISQWCAKYPDRFVGMATLALQHPDLAADQLVDARHGPEGDVALAAGRVDGIVLADGTKVGADKVVLAAGARSFRRDAILSRS